MGSEAIGGGLDDMTVDELSYELDMAQEGKSSYPMPDIQRAIQIRYAADQAGAEDKGEEAHPLGSQFRFKFPSAPIGGHSAVKIVAEVPAPQSALEGVDIPTRLPVPKEQLGFDQLVGAEERKEGSVGDPEMDGLLSMELSDLQALDGTGKCSQEKLTEAMAIVGARVAQEREETLKASPPRVSVRKFGGKAPASRIDYGVLREESKR